MEDLSLHILDVVENSLDAGARHVGITICESQQEDLLSIEISDDGRGMDGDAAQKATDPFFTTRTTRRVGLGLPLLFQAAHAANGKLDIHSAPGEGMTVKATFQLSHVDRKPLGNMAETMTTLIAGRPDVDFTYRHEHGGWSVALDTLELRKRLGGLPLNSPKALTFVREYLAQEEQTFQQER